MNDEINKMFSQNIQKHPYMYIKILLKNSEHMIAVYDGDTADGIAQKFSAEYGIDAKKTQKLARLVQAQIDNNK